MYVCFEDVEIRLKGLTSWKGVKRWSAGMCKGGIGNHDERKGDI